jgi:hypothetical protein
VSAARTARSRASGPPRSISLCAVSRRRFPRSTPEPGPSSRHLHAGHRLASQQAPARLPHGPEFQARFRCRLSVSTRRQWFTRVRLLDPYLTRSRRAVSTTLTTPALKPAQLVVVCGLPLQGRPRRTTGPATPSWPLHLRCSIASPNRSSTSIHLNVRGTRIPPILRSPEHLRRKRRWKDGLECPRHGLPIRCSYVKQSMRAGAPPVIVSGSGGGVMGSARSRWNRRARWRLRQRMASVEVLPSAILRSR